MRAWYVGLISVTLACGCVNAPSPWGGADKPGSSPPPTQVAAVQPVQANNITAANAHAVGQALQAEITRDEQECEAASPPDKPAAQTATR